MIRKLMMIGMLITFLSATTCVFAEDVFVTKNGAKYHKEMCRFIKNKGSLTKLDKTDAIEGNYGPCKRCFKKDVIAEEHHDGQKQVKKINQKKK